MGRRARAVCGQYGRALLWVPTLAQPLEPPALGWARPAPEADFGGNTKRGGDVRVRGLAARWRRIEGEVRTECVVGPLFCTMGLVVVKSDEVTTGKEGDGRLFTAAPVIGPPAAPSCCRQYIAPERRPWLRGESRETLSWREEE